MRGRVLLLVLSSFALAACDDRPRPTPFGFSPSDFDLEARVLAPLTSELRLVAAGAVIEVEVYGEESGGRLHGLGFLARRWPGDGAAIDSAVYRFPPRQSATHSFALRVPAELPDNAQVEIVALALGPTDVAVESIPEAIIVIQCTAGAIWC